MRGQNQEKTQKLIEAIKNNNSLPLISAGENRGLAVFEVSTEHLKPLMQTLRDKHGFDMLIDLTSVDYLGKREIRFEMVYMLLSMKDMQRVRIKTPVAEGEKVPSLIGVWKSANWPEREVYDLMGISFEGHPLMQRIIMPDEYQGHPLRKDFPLQGKGEDYLIEPLLRPVKEQAANRAQQNTN